MTLKRSVRPRLVAAIVLLTWPVGCSRPGADVNKSVVITSEPPAPAEATAVAKDVEAP